MRRLCIFYKIKTFKIPEHLYYLIPNDHRTYNTRNLDFVETYFCRADAFKYSFFPYFISEWNKLDPDLHNAKYTLNVQKISTEVWLTNPKSYLQNPCSFRAKTFNKT